MITRRFVPALSLVGIALWSFLSAGCDSASQRSHRPGSAPPLYDLSRAPAPSGGGAGERRALAGGIAPYPDARTDVRSAAPSGSLPALDEEVWVIVKPDASDRAAQPARSDDIPGSGAMMCRIPAEEPGLPMRDVALPLQHTGVRASISAYIASVEVQQQFCNPYDLKIEAIYVFPLPENAAVTGFVMTIGERKIRGIIRERAEAEQIYAAAKTQGHVASLLTQERPNIFTQHVANIEPQKQVDVHITYFHTLSYDDGWHEFVFPMVVGPRFNPPAPPPMISDGVGAIGRGMPGSSGQPTEVQYLRSHERSGHDISLALDLDAATTIEEIVCSSHAIGIAHEGSEQVRIALSTSDSIPNKDFVLRYRIAGDQVKTALLTHHDSAGGDGYFTLMLYPPRELDDDGVNRQPMEMIFVMDCSGSMSGAPIEQSRDAVLHALDQLRPGDSFQVVRFSNNASQFAAQPMEASSENIRRAQQYVRGLNADGGTMMIEGLRAALDFAHDPERLRIVSFLTDGYIGNEREVLGAVHERVGDARIFSFGVGSSPNRYLMSSMAKLGRGAVAYLGLRDDGGAVMDAFFSRVSRPILTDISIELEGATAREVFPAAIPDLFVGRPVIVTGRYSGGAPTAARLCGRANGQIVQTEVRPGAEMPNDHPALSAVWARLHIADLMDRATWERNGPDALELPQQITAIALQHGLMSAWTSFVAVDSAIQTAGAHGVTIHNAVPVPEGVRYETAVGDR